MNKIRMLLALGLSLVTFAVAGSGSKVYRWVDESGKVHFGDIAPPTSGAAEVKIHSFHGDAVVEGDDAAAGNEVVMYTTSWCSTCRRAREYLTKKAIPFSEWDIESNPYARAEYSILKGRGVPLILVGKQRMNGFSAPKLDKMLVKAGYAVGRERKR